MLAGVVVTVEFLGLVIIQFLVWGKEDVTLKAWCPQCSLVERLLCGGSMLFTRRHVVW